MTKSTSYIGTPRDIVVQRTIRKVVPEIKVKYKYVFVSDAPATKTTYTTEVVLSQPWTEPADFFMRVNFIPKASNLYLDDGAITVTVTPGGKITESGASFKNSNEYSAVITITAGTYGGLKRLVAPPALVDYAILITGYRGGSAFSLQRKIQKTDPVHILDLTLFDDDLVNNLVIYISYYYESLGVTENITDVDASNLAYMLGEADINILFDLYNDFDKTYNLPRRLFTTIDEDSQRAMKETLAADRIFRSMCELVQTSVAEMADKVTEVLGYAQDKDYFDAMELVNNPTRFRRLCANIAGAYTAVLEGNEKSALVIPQHYIDAIRYGVGQLDPRYLALIAIIDDIEIEVSPN